MTAIMVLLEDMVATWAMVDMVDMADMVDLVELVDMEVMADILKANC